MKIALFLGAGASVPYGKPTTPQLREKLIKKHGHSTNDSFLQSFLDCNEFEDIEHLLQSIKDLTELFNEYGGKYLIWYGNRGQLTFNTNRGNISFGDFVKEFPKIQHIFEDEVFDNYSWNHDFDNILPKIFDPIFNLLQTHSDKIRIFTTNYDRSIEEYCSSDNNFRCIDGFKLATDSQRYLWNDGNYSYFDTDTSKINVYLYKIHGSLSWKRHKKYGIERTTSEAKPTDSNYIEDFLIYPTVSPKDGYEIEPYVTIRKQFDNFMKEAEICIV